MGKIFSHYRAHLLVYTLFLRKARYIKNRYVEQFLIVIIFFSVSNLSIQTNLKRDRESRIDQLTKSWLKGQRTATFGRTVTMDTRLTQFQDEFRPARLWKSNVGAIVARIPGTELHRIWGGGNARVIATPPHPTPLVSRWVRAAPAKCLSRNCELPSLRVRRSISTRARRDDSSLFLHRIGLPVNFTSFATRDRITACNNVSSSIRARPRYIWISFIPSSPLPPPSSLLPAAINCHSLRGPLYYFHLSSPTFLYCHNTLPLAISISI